MPSEKFRPLGWLTIKQEVHNPFLRFDNLLKWLSKLKNHILQRVKCGVKSSNPWGWRDGSVGKNVYCSCGRPGFSSKHIHSSSQPSGNPDPGYPMPALTLAGSGTYMVHIYILRHTHTHLVSSNSPISRLVLLVTRLHSLRVTSSAKLTYG